MLALLMIVTTPETSHAQAVTGRLLESGTNEPIALGTVALLDTALVLVTQVFTDSDGEFRIEAPRPGSYYVLARRIGYHTKVDGVLELGPGGGAQIVFYLKADAVRLDPMVVEAQMERSRLYLEGQGFYERSQQGFGHFIDPAEIERRAPLDTRELLRGIAQVYVRLVPMEGVVVEFRDDRPFGDGRCTPNVYIDGQRIIDRDDGIRLDDYVRIESIAAVEVYTGPATIPVQWAGTGSTCGVLVIWTKH